MRCPIDNAELVMSDRQGIEIDYCPQCRGVWLDRGEIDKIIERGQTQAPSQTYHQQRDNDDDNDYRRREEQHGRREEHGHHDQRKKHKESWFGELFGD